MVLHHLREMSHELESWGMAGGAGVLVRMKASGLGQTAFESQLSAIY